MKNNPLAGVLTPKVRRYVYAAYALAGLVVACLQIAEVDSGKAPEVLAYIGIALGTTAASNTPSPERGDERGAIDFVTALLCVFLVLVILLLLGVIHR